MKNFIVIILFTTLILVGCGKIDDAKKAMNAVRQVAEIAEDTADSFMDLGEDEIKKIQLSKNEVKSFFKNIESIKEKYPEIHFQVAQVAFMEAIGEGKNLKDIVEKDMNISFKEYTRLSTVITFAEATGAGLQLSKSMYEQMITGKETLESQLNTVLSSEEKRELETALDEIKKEIKDFEKEMNSDDFANIKYNYDLILKVKEDLDI